MSDINKMLYNSLLYKGYNQEHALRVHSPPSPQNALQQMSFGGQACLNPLGSLSAPPDPLAIMVENGKAV